MAPGVLAPYLARLAGQPAGAAAGGGAQHDRPARVRYSDRLRHLDSACPDAAWCAAALPHLYAAVGNVIFAGIALLAGDGDLVPGWRAFWLPLAGRMVWPVGSYCAFRASETIGIARAAGTWTPLNIIVAFAWGALLFGELDHFSGTRFVLITVALAAILAGILLIVSSQDGSSARVVPANPPSSQAIETAMPLS